MAKRPTSPEFIAETMRRALSQLVESLVAPPHESRSRVDRVQEALSYATLALGATGIDQENLYKAFDVLAAELILDKMEREQIIVYALKLCAVDSEEQASIVATVSPILSQHLDAILDSQSSGEVTPLEIN